MSNRKMKEHGNRTAILIGAGEIGNCIPIAAKQGAEAAQHAKVKQEVITEQDFVIAMDGGLAACEKYGIVPDMIVGDFDSLPEEKQSLLSSYPEECIYRLPCEKDDTDTLAAIKLAIEKGFTQFVIYGGLGGRLSHTVANIQTLLYLKERGMHGVLKGEGCELFLLKNESCVLETRDSGYISVFSYSEKSEGICLTNLKYELENAELKSAFPLGVSNEFVGKEARITVEDGVLLVIVEM